MIIRPADPEADSVAVADIYRPAVESSVATFEEVPPGAEEMEARMRRTLERTPWLVMDDGSGLSGYAYAVQHRERPGYRWAVDVSVYVAQGLQGRGIGRRLYDELLAILRRQRFVNAYAGIALPNPASVALHEAIGMRRIGTHERVGYKLGSWVDVAWYGMHLVEPPANPPEPIPYPDLG